MGRYRRIGPDGPRELTEADRGPGNQPHTLENPLELCVRADSGGEAFVDAATWDALQPKGRTQEEGRRAGGRKPNNPDRYPLSTRIIDLTDGCGSALHGRKSGERLIYGCGRYVNSGAAECHHNTVDADAMLKLVLDALVECVTKAGGREAIRGRLLAKQKDDARYEALAHAFDEIRAERDKAARRVEEFTNRLAVVTVAVSPEEKVDALMLAIDELAAATTNETARERIRPLVLRLGIWVGLDFEGYTKGKGKRPLRRLRRGVIAFGQENLPVGVHGDRHVAVEDTVTAALSPPRRLATQPIRRLDLIAAGPATAAHDDHGASPDAFNDNQGAPPCCRGPSVECGARGGDGTGDGLTAKPISGKVQSRTVSNVGATGFEPATSTSRT
jgi:hypothetical protein